MGGGGGPPLASGKGGGGARAREERPCSHSPVRRRASWKTSSVRPRLSTAEHVGPPGRGMDLPRLRQGSPPHVGDQVEEGMHRVGHVHPCRRKPGVGGGGAGPRSRAVGSPAGGAGYVPGGYITPISCGRLHHFESGGKNQECPVCGAGGDISLAAWGVSNALRRGRPQVGRVAT